MAFDNEIKIDKNGYISVNGTKTKDFWDAAIRSEKMPLRLKIRNICGDETVWKIMRDKQNKEIKLWLSLKYL